MSHNITIEGGTSVRLPTAGKYCDRDIVITATGGGADGDDLATSIVDRTITEYYSDKVTTVGAYAFCKCNKLASVSCPNVITIKDDAFDVCYGLTSANFPNVETIGRNAFYSCTNLASVSCPNVRTIGVNAFSSCPKIQSISLLKCESIDSAAFAGCSSLTALILGTTEKVCTATVDSVLRNTPIAKNAGYIYVPSSLIESYKTATNWTTYATQFRALEDHTVDGTITGALDESKI